MASSSDTTVDEKKNGNSGPIEWTNDKNKLLLQLMLRKHLPRTYASRAAIILQTTQGDCEDQLIKLQALNNGRFSSNPAEWNINQREIHDKRVQLLARPEEDVSFDEETKNLEEDVSSDEESNNLEEAITIKDKACSVNRTKATTYIAASTRYRCEKCTSSFKYRWSMVRHRKAGNCLLPGKKRNYTAAEWESMKPKVKGLYDNSFTAREIAQIMKAMYGFDATVRSYQRHFKSWEWSKHDKWEPWKAVIYALRHETDEESSEKLRTLHDVIIPVHTLRRCRRNWGWSKSDPEDWKPILETIRHKPYKEIIEIIRVKYGTIFEAQKLYRWFHRWGWVGKARRERDQISNI